MALDLNHGVHFIRNGTEYFYGSYTHAVSPALAFSVGGVTRYVPFESGGGYLKIMQNGNTYGVKNASAIVSVSCTFTVGTSNWTSCTIGVTDNGFAEASTISVEVYSSGGTETYTSNLSANNTRVDATFTKWVPNKNSIKATVTVFGRTYTASKNVSSVSQVVSLDVTIS